MAGSMAPVMDYVALAPPDDEPRSSFSNGVTATLRLQLSIYRVRVQVAGLPRLRAVFDSKYHFLLTWK